MAEEEVEPNGGGGDGLYPRTLRSSPELKAEA